MPEIYPGMSTDHRDGLSWGQGRIPRRAGDFLWEQFVAARAIGAKTAFVGMTHAGVAIDYFRLVTFP